MTGFKYGEITEKIIGAAFRVHNTPGYGFHEVIYQRAMEMEFRLIPMDYAREFEMPIYYPDEQVGASKRLEFHVLINKKHNPAIIHHPIPSKNSY